MSEATKGVIAVILSCVIWGLSGLFYKLLNDVPPMLVLAHRTFWGVAFFLIILAVQGKLTAPFAALRSRKTAGVLGLASALIAVNWLMFVYAIQTDQALEASLGYYIFPLVTVMCGLVLYQERLARAEWGAVALAALAVVVLSLGLGVTPWIALVIAGTFGFYGALKKRLTTSAVVSVTAESLVLLPIMAVWALWVAVDGGAVFGGSWTIALILMLSGPMTATPLILFSYGARRVNLTSVGLLSYLNPSLQFLVAVLLFQEPFGRWHGVAFAMIWAGLAIYSLSRLRQERSAATAWEKS